MAITFKIGGQEPTVKGPVGRSAVLYGPPFSGKTSTLQYDPSIRALLIDFDKNSAALEECGHVDIIGVSDFKDALAIKEGISTGTLKIGGQVIPMNYDLYVVDSFTSFEECIKRWVVNDFAPERRREIKGKFGAQTDWGDLQSTEIQFFRDMHEMTRREVNPINVLWLGHDMVTDTPDGLTEKLQLKLQGKFAAPGIMSATDAVFYMFKVRDEEKKQTNFGIYTVNTGAIVAEARLSFQKRKAFPEFIWFPKWGEIFKTLGATNLKGGTE